MQIQDFAHLTPVEQLGLTAFKSGAAAMALRLTECPSRLLGFSHVPHYVEAPRVVAVGPTEFVMVLRQRHFSIRKTERERILKSNIINKN
jgi:hypothetical protein